MLTSTGDGAEENQARPPGSTKLPFNVAPTDAAFLGIGFVLGALAFSLLVGRERARALARIADRLARPGAGSDVGAGTGGRPAAVSRPKVRYPDRMLREAIEQLSQRISEVEALATTDPQTRLLNRTATLRVLAAEIERSNRYGRPLAIALIDIDHFKRVNDTHGHAVGDEVLRHVATVLRENVRSVDSLGRFGGEEFLLVMPETDLDGGIASAENLRRVLGRTTVVVATRPVDLEICVTISAGVTGGDGHRSLDLDQLLREADGALYGAKEAGRDQVVRHRELDERTSLVRATVDPAARVRAADIGRGAFGAAHEHLLGALADRPGWAGGASRLIADLSADMGRAVGLPDADIERIRTASLLHDLGKLAIPDEILSKPSELDPLEWRTIVEHPRIGQVVLEQAGAIRDAAQIVLHHHERFDGTGYPHGLAGNEIPLGSRIVAIADAYEAMISVRPYKPAMSHEEAIAELRRNRGTQFDPELVDLFISLVGEGSTAPHASAAGAPHVSAAGAPPRAAPRAKSTRGGRTSDSSHPRD
ncbi:MAG TPA: diguanylate cyclase [Candidatus Binatia bacterium]|nr:diguanylate cyclase [Candidatus Binatia bacterium]